MNVDVQKILGDGEMQQGEGIFVLHQIRFICFLDGPGNDAALDIAPVDKIILVIPVATADERLANKPADADFTLLPFHREQIGRYLPAVNRINQIPKIVIAGGIQLVLIILDKTYRQLRMGEGNLLYQIRHIASLCHGTF